MNLTDSLCIVGRRSDKMNAKTDVYGGRSMLTTMCALSLTGVSLFFVSGSVTCVSVLLVHIVLVPSSNPLTKDRQSVAWHLLQQRDLR